MALIASGIHGSSPGMSYEFYAEQTSGSGNNRTIKITLKLKAGQYSTSYYGYPVQWRANVNGSWSGWMSVKGGEAWRGSDGFRTFTYTATTNVGTTSSKSITVGIETDSIGYTHWDFSKTGSLTVSQTNVAPSLSGTVSIDGSTSNRTISENATQLVIKTPAASDTNLSGYRFRVSINGGGYTEIYRGASTSYTHNISGYGEGTTFKYVVDAYDSVGAWSANIYSPTITKNKFTQDNISSTSSIAFGTTTIAFTYSGASNTQSGVTITKTLSCDNGITVYNPNITAASPINLTIYKSGTAPSTPYVKFDDIKKVFATTTNKGKGVLNFTLTSKNSNETTKTSSEAINVNLQVNPNNTSASISLVQTESTNYLSIASSTNKYFIPDGSKVTRVKWSSVTGKLGEAVTYQVYVAYGSGGWTKIADLSTGTTYYNHAVPVQTVSQQFKYKVRVISTYNSDNFSEATTSAQTLHYYNEPSLTQGTITRAATTADVIVTIKSNSSIPNINTKGTWAVYKSGTTTPVVSSGNLSVAQTSQTLKLTGLTDANTYDLKVTYNDDTGYMATNKVTTIKISANLPIMFINKYGVGVNGVAASSSYSIDVNGAARIRGSLTTDKGVAITTVGTSWIGGKTHTNLLNFTGNSTGSYHPMIRYTHNSGNVTNIGAYQDRIGFYGYKAATTANQTDVAAFLDTSDNSFVVSGTLKAANVTIGGANVYHTGRKPTPADIGALPSSGGIISSSTLPQLTIKNPSGQAADLLFDRGSNANWKITTTGGNFRLQCDYTSGKVPLYDVMRLDYNTGNVWFKGCGYTDSGIFLLPNNMKLYVEWYEVAKNSSRRITLPTGLYKSRVLPPMTSNYVTQGNYNAYSTVNTIAVSHWDLSGVTLLNYDSSKPARVMLWVIGE